MQSLFVLVRKRWVTWGAGEPGRGAEHQTHVLQKEPNMTETSSFVLIYQSVLAPLLFKLLLMFIKPFRAES